MRDRLSSSSFRPSQGRRSGLTASRPTISAPQGPVLRSNGPPLERADTITIVPSIRASATGQDQEQVEYGEIQVSKRGKARELPENEGPQRGAMSSQRTDPLYRHPQRRFGLGDRRILAEMPNTNNQSSRVLSPGEPRLERPGGRQHRANVPAQNSDSSQDVRRLSASFSQGGPLSSNPTVASSDVHAVTGTGAARNDEAGGDKTRNDLARNDENQPPEKAIHVREPAGISSSGSSPSLTAASFTSAKSKIRPASRRGIGKRLPKSRTMTVLSNLTASLSRSSLSSFSGTERKVSRQTVASRNISSSSSTLTAATPTTGTSRPPTPADTNPLIVTTPQPSEYWTGRFLSLHDRFHGEALQAQSLSTLVSAHASKSTVLPRQQEAYQGRGNLPLSTTTALDRYGSSATREAARLSDEDARCLRIFLHLDSLCATPEAQKSLRAWQEEYARSNNRATLLPEGATMDKGLVARIFSGGRRSMGARPEKQIIEGKYRTVKRATVF